jgi:L-aspartate oxidase
LARAGEIPAALSRRYLLRFDTDACVAHQCDVLVVGSGIAGLTAALAASRTKRVALVTKSVITETNTWYAQGGIAGAVGEADSVELHLADTLVVGQGLCDEDVVRAVVGEAPEALSDLRDLGVDFDLEVGGEVALAREGGHSLPRVLHSGDATGAAIQGALTKTLRSASGVEVFEQRFLVDLLTAEGRCVGALVLNTESDDFEVYWAGAVVLATGGAGQAYRVTTNPLIATGDGLAAAWRAGAEVADLEFVQFHPTALDHDAAPRFLITEALRGEGAYLLNQTGDRFMLGAHPLAELAPRDVVTRAIEREVADSDRKNVMLDARHLGEEHLRVRFPTIWAACAEAGYNLAYDLVPVAPAAHYMVGGVRVDIDGRTTVPGLYASGEVAESGLHGANRLASNSLLEGLVFSRRIVRALDDEASPAVTGRIVAEAADVEGPDAGTGGSPNLAAPAVREADAPLASSSADVRRTLARLREIMQADVAMSRMDAGLAEAAEYFEALAPLLDPRSASPERFELANLATVATLVAHSAWLRTESRGCHSRLDFPERDDGRWRGRTVMRRGAPYRFEPVGSTRDLLSPTSAQTLE